MIAFYVFAVCLFKLVEGRTYPCSTPGELIYVYDDTWGPTFEEYCYKNIGTSGFGIFQDLVDACADWYEDSHLVSFKTPEEQEWVHDELISLSSGNVWIGLLKTSFQTIFGSDENCCTGCFEHPRCCADTEERYRWKDGTDKSWFIENYMFSANTGVYSCEGINSWCHYMSQGSDTMIYNTPCVDTNYDGVCKYKIPFCDMPAYQEGVCSGRGDCVGNGTCVCDFYYWGSKCENTHMCNNIRHDNDLVCGERGNCTDTNTCLCEDAYYGENCEFDYATSGSVCSGAGEISHSGFRNYCYKKLEEPIEFFDSMDACKEWDDEANILSLHSYIDEVWVKENFGTNFKLGLIKNEPNSEQTLHPCPLEQGYTWFDFSDTSYAEKKGFNLKCTDNLMNWCFAVVDNYFWTDYDCYDGSSLDTICMKEILTCGGLLSSDPEVCSAKGLCQSNGECDCVAEGYYGPTCAVWDCYDIRYNDKSATNPPCSGHGDCTGPNSCICDTDYGGTQCQYSSCNFIVGSDSSVCSGHGECIEYDVCYCVWGWGGDWCESFFPPDHDEEPYNLYEWTTTDYLGLPMISIFHVYRPAYPLYSTNFLKDEFLDFFEAEKYANRVWYPGKGHLFSARNEEEFVWSRGLRPQYGLPYEVISGTQDDRDYDIWPGLTKVQSGDDIQSGCSGGDFDGLTFTDGTSWTGVIYSGLADWYDGVWAQCNDMGQCFRIANYDYSDVLGWGPSWEDINHDYNDQPCFAPRVGLFHYVLKYCDGILSNNPTVCNGRGFCWENEECTCFNEGLVNYMDDKCDTTYCHGVQSNESTVCGGNGLCISLDTCRCDEDWYGPNCTVSMCFGIFSNETEGTSGGLTTQVCSGHGTCLAKDTCDCYDSFYYGDDCENTYCNYIPSTDDSVCFGHGECWPKDTCTCNTSVAEYDGDSCELFYCFGIRSDSDSVCSRGGICADVNLCDCFEHYDGEQCNNTECYGLWGNDSDVCNGIGDCTAYQVCECEDPQLLGNCDIYVCEGYISSDFENVCSGKGNCTGTDECLCEEGYFGQFCEISMCYGVLSNETDSVCWGRGTCEDTNTCTCNEPYWLGTSLNLCNWTTCDDTLNTDDDVCSSRGDCVSYETCVCDDDGFDPTTYCSGFMCYDKFESESCSNPIGSCVGEDDCDCTSNAEYFGKECEERITSLVADFYYDFIGDNRIFTFLYEASYESVIGYSHGESVSCDTIFSSIQVDGSGDANEWIGTTAPPECFFGGDQSLDHSSKIFLILGGNAPLLEEGVEYQFTFPLRTVPTQGPENLVFTYTPDEDEPASHVFDPFFEDNNNEHSEEDDDEDDDEDEDEDDVQDAEEDDISGSNAGAIVGGVFGGLAFLILLLIVICSIGCFCLLLCICCCCLIGCCVSLMIVKGNKSEEDEMLRDFNMTWKVHAPPPSAN